MTAPISLDAIEDAIVARLASDDVLTALRAGGYLGSWQGSPEDARTTGRAIRYPLITIIYAGGAIESKGMLRFAHLARWQVTIATRSHRSLRAARATGDAGIASAYTLIAEALRVLSGVDLGLDGVGELRPHLVGPLEESEPGEARYAIGVEVPVLLQVDDVDLQTSGARPVADLEQIRATYAVDTPPNPIVTDEVTP